MSELGEVGTPIEFETFEVLAQKFYEPTEEGEEARKILDEINNREDAWLQMPDIIVHTQQLRTLVSALNIFKNGVARSWNILSDEEKEHYKQFFFEFVISMSDSGPPDVVYYANNVLIEILKNEWPFNWKNFIRALREESKRSENICKNNLKIVALLSDEVHQTRDNNLTSDRLTELDEALTNDFSLIFSHIEEVLSEAASPELRAQALETLSHFLHWVDLRLITSSQLCQHMVSELLPEPIFRAPVLKCFAAIANHTNSIAESNMTTIFELLVQNLNPLLDSPEQIEEFCDDPDAAHALVEALTGFLSLDSCGLLQISPSDATLKALLWMANLVAFTDGTSFEECISLWHTLSKQFTTSRFKFSPPMEIINPLKCILCQTMRRPITYTIYVNENNEIQGTPSSEETSDASEFYKMMSETLYYLCKLTPEDTEILDFLMEKLREPFSYASLPYYYSIGSISGIYSSEINKTLLTSIIDIINPYINLNYENHDQILMAANFGYVTSSFAHFLGTDWSLLNSILSQLLEMSAPQLFFPLQVMLVNCFCRICKARVDDIVKLHPGQTTTLLEDYLSDIESFVQTFAYEALGPLFEMLAYSIKHFSNIQKKSPKTVQYIQTLFQTPLAALNSSIENLSPEVVDDRDFAMGIIVPLDALSRVIEISDQTFTEPIHEIIARCIELLDFYTGAINASQVDIRNILNVKHYILKLFESYFIQFPLSDFLAELLNKVIMDYSSIEVPSFRSPQSLDAIASFLRAKKGDAAPFDEQILTQVIIPTNEIITQCDLQELPELKHSYFALLSTIMTGVFDSIQAFDSELFTEMLNSIIDGVSYPQQNICETSLNCIRNVITSVDSSQDVEFKKQFYTAFYMPILNRLLEVLTDTSHKFVFGSIVQVMYHMLQLCWQDTFILEIDEDPRFYVSQSMCDKLLELFPTLNPENTLNITQTWVNEQAYLTHFRENLSNFLINLRKASPKEAQAYNQNVDVEEEEASMAPDDMDGLGSIYYDEQTMITEF